MKPPPCLLLLLCCCSILGAVSNGFLVPSSLPLQSWSVHQRYHHVLLRATTPVLREDDDEEWREFRAKLVGRSVFDTGDIIQRGSIVLSQVESSLGCHDLQQPYLHKAVVLLTDHAEDGTTTSSTKGLILNRPSNLVLTDNDILNLVEDDVDVPLEQPPSMPTNCHYSNNNNNENDNSWNMHFGGDLSGLYDSQPMIVCLHTIDTHLARSVSNRVINNLWMSSVHAARALIANHQLTVSSQDFVTFYGYCEWEPGQLQAELRRGSWSMAAADAGTIWKELQTQQQQQQHDPRGAGLTMWESLRERVGKDATVGCLSFSDLMLKEWCTEMLCIDDPKHSQQEQHVSDESMQKQFETDLLAGQVFRASSTIPSPYLLEHQFLHKCIVLLLQDRQEASVGIILNLPSTERFSMETPNGKNIEFTIRMGGTSGEDGHDPLVWLHCSKSLRKLGIGSPLGENNSVGGSLLWTVSMEQVQEAIDLGLALPREFLLVQGFVAWEKQEGAGGIGEEILAGALEPVPKSQIEDVFVLLQSQKLLTQKTLEWNLSNALRVWTVAGLQSSSDPDIDRCVYETDILVSTLADAALQVWTKLFLLGDTEHMEL